MRITWQKPVTTNFGMLVVLAVAEEGAHYRSLVTIPGVKINCSTTHWATVREAKMECAAIAMTAVNNLYNELLGHMNQFGVEDESTDRISEVELPESKIILPAGVA